MNLWDESDDIELQTQGLNLDISDLHKPSTLSLGHGGSPQYILISTDSTRYYSNFCPNTIKHYATTLTIPGQRVKVL